MFPAPPPPDLAPTRTSGAAVRRLRDRLVDALIDLHVTGRRAPFRVPIEPASVTGWRYGLRWDRCEAIEAIHVAVSEITAPSSRRPPTPPHASYTRE
jgi:hypothetical protein